jgi:hypothetical protein
MPRYLKWTGIAAALLLVVSCFTPWVVIESKNLILSGVDTTGTNYGRPAFIHFIFTAFFLLLTLVPRVWAKRANLLAAALNLAWAIRNFFIISACSGGECPVKKAGLLLVLLSSTLMLISALFPDIELHENKRS